MFNIPKRVKLIAFEYENKESKERLNWSSFKEAHYRNFVISQQP